MIPESEVLTALAARLGSEQLQIWVGVVTAYWFAMLVLEDNVVGSYALAVRVRDRLRRTDGILIAALTHRVILVISFVVSWIGMSLCVRGYPGFVGFAPVSTVAFVLASIYTTVRLGRWPGVSFRHYRRLSLPTYAIFNSKYLTLSYTRRHLERYERLRARRLGLPVPEARPPLPVHVDPPSVGGRTLLP